MRHYCLAISLVSCFFLSPVYALKIVAGNGGRMTTTFPIGVHAFSSSGGRMLIGAGVPLEDEATKRFSLAMSDHGSAFEPLMYEQVILNNQVNQANPAYGKAINLLHAADRALPLPIFTLQDDPHTLYMLESVLRLSSDTTAYRYPLLISKQIPDATGAIGDIHAIASASSGERFLLFVAVSPAGKPFGVPGSGIALLELVAWQAPAVWPVIENENVVLQPQEKVRHISLVVRQMLKTITKARHKKNTSVSQDADAQPTEQEKDAPGAWPFDAFYPVTLHEAATPQLHNRVQLHWDANVSRLFIGLQGQTAAQEDALFCAVMVAQLMKDAATGHIVLALSPLVPVNSITADNQIVATKGANKAVSVYALSSMPTSTGLNYLIVAGGNDTREKVGNRVWALPLINDGVGGIINGLIADSTWLPQTCFGHTYPFSFVHRGFMRPTMPMDDEETEKRSVELLTIATSDDKAAMVGNGPLPLAPHEQVTQLFTHGDAVYATIAAPFSATTKPGIFYSQALFDAQGRIMAWSAWQRAGGNTNPILGAAIDGATGDMWQMGGAHGMSVGYTQWGHSDRNFLLGGTDDPQVGFLSLVNTYFPATQGGVLGLYDFASDTPGFGIHPEKVGDQLALQVITGNKMIMLIETASNQEPYACKAHGGDFATGLQQCNDGTLCSLVPNERTKVLIIRGGVLEQLGAITCAEVSRVSLVDGTARGWLFVGGVHGVAMLCRPDGSGWDTGLDQGLHAAFGGLTTDMSFKMIGNYHFVHKLICDGTYLYVIAHDRVDRIPLNDLTAAPTSLTAQLDAAIFDGLISGPCALLATSKGLYQSMQDIRLQVPTWRKIELPESAGAVTYLDALSPTGPQGFAQQGNIYLINKQPGTGVTRVYRCAVTSQNGEPVIEPISNCFIKGAPSYFLQYNSHRNFASTDGGFFYSSLLDHKMPTNSDIRNGNTQEQVFPQLLLNLKPGYRFMEATKTTRPMGVSQTSHARLLKRSTASGTLLLVSKIGLTAHE